MTNLEFVSRVRGKKIVGVEQYGFRNRGKFVREVNSLVLEDGTRLCFWAVETEDSPVVICGIGESELPARSRVGRNRNDE